MANSLHIFKASAGSGKTFTLAYEYISIMFEHIAQAGALHKPEKYSQFRNTHRELLAVTFTNKATNEMKSRIIRELYKLAAHQQSDYRDKLCEQFSLTQDESLLIDRWSKILLDDILDDYGTFSITTIDSFFQKIVRQFARELNLPGGYTIDMDEEQIRTMAVDNMLYDLDSHPELKEWLGQMISEKIDNGKNWNVQRLILDYAKVLFNEHFRILMNNPQVRQLLLQPKKAKDILDNIIKTRQSTLEAIYKELQDILSAYNLSLQDINSRADFAKLITIEEAPSNTFYEIVNNHNAAKCFLSNAIKKGRALEAFDKGVYECYQRGLQTITKYLTAKNILKSFYIVGIIGTLDSQIVSDNHELNRLPLADTNRRLNQIIDGSDIPFIYEKISQRIKHYLIDEFQDTSALQWNNFLPLVKESLDSGYKNLIVGDVKQSIYRWRNGDADLLANQVKNDLPQYYNENTLDTNYRSCPQIINWNNEFFNFFINCIDAKNTEQTDYFEINKDITQANKTYQNIEGAFKTAVKKYYDESTSQKINPKNNYSGLVSLSFITPSKPEDSEDSEVPEKDYPALLESELIQLLDKLTKQRHIMPKRISIMVRRNSEGVQTAAMLTKHGYKVVSTETLILSSAKSVQLLINIFKHIDRPKENLFVYNAYFFFAALLQRDTAWCLEQTEKFIRINSSESETQNQDTLLGKAEAVISQSDTLYQKAEMLINWMSNGCGDTDRNITASETAYLQTLLDSIHHFASIQSTDIHAFLQWWEQKGNSLSIPAPEQDDAIQIITIHKAKGLEFDVAIMPFCNYALDGGNSDILWLEPKKEHMSEDFCKIPVVPVEYSPDLAQTECAQAYWNEYLHNFLDTLNTTYVAFTRPRYELYLFSEVKTRKSDAYLGTFLQQYVTNHLHLNPIAENDNITTYQINDSEGRNDWTICDDENQTAALRIPNMLQSTPTDHLIIAQQTATEETKRGELLHYIMSCTRYAEDLPNAIRKTCTGANSSYADDISRQLTQLLNLPQVKPWFEHDHIILNEQTIITSDDTQYRPDRIMLYPNGTIIVVDYKFTNKKSEKYLRQVTNYINILRDALPKYDYQGSPVTTQKITGYLLYADLQQIEQVL